MGKLNRKSKQGFTLVETMITLSILMVGAFATVTIMYYQKKDQRIAQTKATFNSLVSAAQYAAINPKVMLDSKDAQDSLNVYLNPLLKACIDNTPNDCADATEQDIRLFQGIGTTKREITGSFDANGKECVDPLALTCVFKVQARAKVTCPALQSTCARADSFLINYSVEYKKPDDMPPINRVETVVGGARTPAMIPGSAIYAQEFNKVECKDTYPLPPDPAYVPGNEDMQSVIGVMSTGQPICGKDPALEAVKTEVCKMKILNIWQNGGTVSDPPCGPVTVDKVFKLSAASNSLKTTTDCVAFTGTVYDQSGNLVTSYSGYPGGQVTKNGVVLWDADVAAFMAQYGLNPLPVFDCKKTIDTLVTLPAFTTAGGTPLTLPSNYLLSSLDVKVIGGGAGGGGSGLVNGGLGGGAGALQTGTITGAPSSTCTVTVGAYGTGASSGGPCGPGSPGQSSSVVCSNGSVSATGGVARGCNSGPDGDKGDKSPLTPGFAPAVTGDNGGTSAGSGDYGAGGGGGACNPPNLFQGNHSGGNGIGGYVEVKYTTRDLNIIFVP